MGVKNRRSRECFEPGSNVAPGPGPGTNTAHYSIHITLSKPTGALSIGFSQLPKRLVSARRTSIGVYQYSQVSLMLCKIDTDAGGRTNIVHLKGGAGCEEDVRLDLEGNVLLEAGDYLCYVYVVWNKILEPGLGLRSGILYAVADTKFGCAMTLKEPLEHLQDCQLLRRIFASCVDKSTKKQDLSKYNSLLGTSFRFFDTQVSGCRFSILCGQINDKDSTFVETTRFDTMDGAECIYPPELAGKSTIEYTCQPGKSPMPPTPPMLSIHPPVLFGIEAQVSSSQKGKRSLSFSHQQSPHARFRTPPTSVA